MAPFSKITAFIPVLKPCVQVLQKTIVTIASAAKMDEVPIVDHELPFVDHDDVGVPPLSMHPLHHCVSSFSITFVGIHLGTHCSEHASLLRTVCFYLRVC